MNTPDEALVRSALEGDRAAFATLVTRHYDRIFGLCWRLTGNRSDAEDLTQEVCAALPAKLASWRAEARFGTWLYRVIVNAAHDHRRRFASHQRGINGWGDWEMARQSAMAEDREAQAWLAQAMQSLTPELRDTVALVLGEDLTHAEAGSVLGISEGTVAWRMSEVRKRLRSIAVQEAGQ